MLKCKQHKKAALACKSLQSKIYICYHAGLSVLKSLSDMSRPLLGELSKMLDSRTQRSCRWQKQHHKLRFIFFLFLFIRSWYKANSLAVKQLTVLWPASFLDTSSGRTKRSSCSILWLLISCWWAAFLSRSIITSTTWGAVRTLCFVR